MAHGLDVFTACSLKFRLARSLPSDRPLPINVCFKPSTADSTSLPTTMQVRDATVGPLLGTFLVSG